MATNFEIKFFNFQIKFFSLKQYNFEYLYKFEPRFIDPESEVASNFYWHEMQNLLVNKNCFAVDFVFFTF